MYDKFMILLGAVLPFFNLPHVFKMIEVQSSAGQSLPAIILLTISFAFFLIYGVRQRDKVITITYAAAILMNIIFMATIYYYA
jgi:uncharacterized protein with PQ loop repeat